MARRWGAMIVGMIGIGVGCGENHPQGSSGHQNPPDAGGAMAGGGGGAAGGQGMGGDGAAGAAPGGTVSPSSFVSPATAFTPGSICEANGDCWYSPIPTGDFWEAVASAGRTDLWIGGVSSNVLHLQAGHWSALSSPLTETNGIWASSAGDVWLGGESPTGNAAMSHWDGHALTETVEFSSGAILDVWGSGPNDVYAVGFVDAIEHWDGTTWAAVSGVTGTSVSGSGPNDVWVGSNANGMQHFDGAAWSAVPALATFLVEGVVATAADDVWVAGENATAAQQVQHFDGRSWTVSLDLGGSGPFLESISADGHGDVWTVGFDTTSTGSTTVQKGFTAHFDGTSWTVGPAPPPLLFRVAAAPGFGDIAVGQNGGMVSLKSNPSLDFTDLRSGPEQDLVGTWGSSPTDMWAVGHGGTVLHFDGSQVIDVPSGVTVDLTDVWGTAPDDVWIVGDAGTALHFDGTTLSKVATSVTGNLLAVFTAARGDVWMGGQGSTLLHVKGATVSPVSFGQTSGSPLAVLDLHGLSATDVWLCGGGDSSIGFFQPPGLTAHFDGTAWSPVTLQPTSGFPFHRIWELAPNDVWVLTQLIDRDNVDYWHFDGATWTEEVMSPSPQTFMFPEPETALGSFVFGPHDRWTVGTLGAWERNTQ